MMHSRFMEMRATVETARFYLASFPDGPGGGPTAAGRGGGGRITPGVACGWRPGCGCAGGGMDGGVDGGAAEAAAIVITTSSKFLLARSTSLTRTVIVPGVVPIVTTPVVALTEHPRRAPRMLYRRSWVPVRPVSGAGSVLALTVAVFGAGRGVPRGEPGGGVALTVTGFGIAAAANADPCREMPARRMRSSQGAASRPPTAPPVWRRPL